MWSVKTKRWSAAGLIFIGVVAGIIFASNFNWTPKGLAKRPAGDEFIENQDQPSAAVLRLQDTGKAFTVVSKDVLPTVVSISTSKMIKRSSRSDDFWEPLLRDFFGDRRSRSRPELEKQVGLGSGVIVSKDGYILTNNHVIENADDIEVITYDKRRFEAKMIGTDPLTEIAVIKIEGKDLLSARLGDSEEMEIGEWVLAIGNPLGFTSTVTAGIVSALGRDINIITDEETGGSGGYSIENFIQTDAVINRGNSGGPLVNLKSEVIGINTAIATGTGYYTGYGFAVPINLARKIMKDLIKNGYVVRAFLGIGMRQVTEVVAERFGLDRPKGVLIDQVMEDAPAEKAGIRVLDIILMIDGKEMGRANEIQNYVALKNPGDVVTLTVLRKGKEKEIRIELGERQTGRDRAESDEPETFSELGLEVRTLKDEDRSRLRYYQNDSGVLVVRVEPYGAAFDAGIRDDQLITKIEDYPIKSISDYRKALRSFKKGQVVIFYLKDQDTFYHLFVKLP